MTAEHDRHASPNTTSAAARSHNAKTVVLYVAASLACGIVLEAGTLFGAPLQSVVNLDDWSLRRIAIFTVISFFFLMLSIHFDWRDRLSKALSVLKSFFAKNGKRVLAVLAIGILCGTAVSALITITTEFSEPLPLTWLCVSLAIVIAAMAIFRQHLFRKLEWFFLLAALLFGSFLCFNAPVSSVVSWDDQIHYDQSVSISYLGRADYTTADISITNLTSYLTLSPQEEYYSLSTLDSQRDQMDETGDSDNPVVQKDNQTSLNLSPIAYSSIGYIPSAVGLWVGRLLHASFSIQYALGKFANLLFYAIMVFMGIRKLVSKKALAAFIALLPVCIFLASNYSYDPWLTACTIYGFACYIGVLQRNEPLRPSDAFKIIAAFVLGLGPKAVYFPLMLILLVMPKSKLTGKVKPAHWRIAVIASTAAVMATFAVPMLFNGAPTDLRGSEGVNSSGQISFILSNPITYLLTVLQWCQAELGNINEAGMHITALAYPAFSNQEACINIGRLYILALPLVALASRAKDSRSFAKPHYWIASFASCAVTLGLIITALYISFNSVGSSSIAGVQGRYLLPLLLPFFALCLNFKFPVPRNRNVTEGICFGVGVMLLFATLMFVYAEKFVA